MTINRKEKQLINKYRSVCVELGNIVVERWILEAKEVGFKNQVNELRLKLQELKNVQSNKSDRRKTKIKLPRNH